MSNSSPVCPRKVFAGETLALFRSGRCRQQVFVPSPPMFRVSWDVLKANAARDGLTWISRELWSSTGAAG
jgi:hypothetical protein